MTVDVLNKGFFHDPSADPEQYIFGDTHISAEPLQPNRDWRPFTEGELQIERGFDPLDCASINTERAVRILIKRLFNEEV